MRHKRHPSDPKILSLYLEDIRYLKVDLLVKPRDDLTSIVRVFGEDVAVFSNGKVDEFYYVYFKIAGN